MSCPKCGAQVAVGSGYCPACGTALANQGMPAQPLGSIQPVTPAGPPLAPFGVDPLTGKPYSDKSKLAAGLLQIFLPFGVGRFYTGHTGLGVAQLLVTLITCGVASLWPLIDGIIILATSSEDASGRPLRP